MNDSAAKGIKNTKQTGQLRKDAAVQGRKTDLGKRSSSSGGGLQPSNSSNSSNSVSSTSSTSTTRSSSSISNLGARNASRRMQNGQTVNKAINIAKKIPVAQKYAKMAEKIQKIKSAKSKGVVKSFLGDKSSEKPTESEIEAANTAEQTGQEFDPQDVDSKFTIKFDRKTKILAISIVVGILASYVIVGIFALLSVMDSAKEAYLASRQNPSENEFEAAYNAQSGDDRDGGTTDDDSPATVDSTGNAVVDRLNSIALSEANNNTRREKYQDWFGSYDNWCGMFVSWLFDQVDGLDKYYVKSGQAGPGARYSIERGYGKWYEDECTDSKTVPKPGDVLHWEYYPSVDKMSSKHVGYVYKVDNDYIYTVEGNHLPDNVTTVKHERKDCKINGYYRPNY